MTVPIEEDKNAILIEMLEEVTWINKTNIATELVIKENSKKTDKTDEELLPEEYYEYLDIFSEEKAHHLPESQPWDHKIEMKEGFEPKSFKNYNLTLVEQLKLDKFLEENLEKEVHQTISVAYGISIFLCIKEGWQTLTLSGLPVLE